MRTRGLLGILFVLAVLLASCGSDHDGGDARAPGGIPFIAASVEAGGAGGFAVTWQAPEDAGAVTVYAGDDAIARHREVGSGSATDAIEVLDLPDAPRWYVELVPEEGEPLVVADRSLHLASAPNLRDAGGYRTEDGTMPRHQDLLAELVPALAAVPDVRLRILSATSVEDVIRLVVEGEVEHLPVPTCRRWCAPRTSTDCRWRCRPRAPAGGVRSGSGSSGTSSSTRPSRPRSGPCCSPLPWPERTFAPRLVVWPTRSSSGAPGSTTCATSAWSCRGTS